MIDAHDKSEIRNIALAARAGVSDHLATAFAHRLAQRGLDFVGARGAHAVSAYWPIGDEIDTRPLLEGLAGSGVTVGLPVTGRRGTPLVFRRWHPKTVLVPGRMDIPEPPPEAAVIEPDLLFVPLAAFDRRGHRVGYGAGFYDATLASLRARKTITAIGLAYAVQEALFVPSEDHDQPLDVVVTDKETIFCAASR